MKKHWLLLLFVLAADQITKYLARRMEAPRTLIPGILQLRCVWNDGVAFSLLRSSPLLLTALSAAALATVYLLIRKQLNQTLTAAGFCLLLGGAVSNQLDRLLFSRVTDMIELLFVRFAVFNVADIAVVIGVGLLAWSLIFQQGRGAT